MDKGSLRHRAAVRGLLDDVAAGFRWAVDDIRQEVVERPWFGRETTPEHMQDFGSDDPALQAYMGPRDHSQVPAEPERKDPYGYDRLPEPQRDEPEIER